MAADIAHPIVMNEEKMPAKDPLREDVPSGLGYGSLLSDEEAEELLRTKCIDLIVFDRNFDGESIGEIVRELKSKAPDGTAMLAYFHLRGRRRALPILVLKSRQSTTDELFGLIDGRLKISNSIRADPNTWQRRQASPADIDSGKAASTTEAGGLTFDTASNEVVLNGRIVNLSRVEFKLLWFLASNPKQVFSREQLLSGALGPSTVCRARTVDVHIRRLREKIEKRPDHPRRIVTIRGVGYRYTA